ncbi:DNA polymerase phi-domain-containing protein [Hysterangium stoloniferum]|nr:DNA polymerase phi-domain-containing protein [Hysterangium stoloniferum]
MSTTLPLFWHLSSNSKADRLDASVKLVGALEQFQKNFTPFAPESSSEDEGEDEGMDTDDRPTRDGLDGPNASDVAYSVRRLVRGLASPRESSRLGFAVVLTELLSRLDTVSATQIISLISQASQIHGAMKGQEERDTLFARLFGITALIQSGLLFRSTPLATSSTSQCTLKDFQDSMDMLLGLQAKKSFLKEPSYWSLILALRALASSEVEWKKEALTWIAEKVFIEDKSWSPEKVGVTLVMQGLAVDVSWKALLSPTFKNGDVLISSNLNNLAKILKDAEIEDDSTVAAKSKSPAAWKPQLHFVWNMILDIYFPLDPNTAQSKIPRASYPEFFKVAVDESLLSPTSSDGRKLWGFELFRLSLARVPASDLPRLFTSNFMRSWVNHLSKPDRYLHKAAKMVASSLPPIVMANPSAGFPVLLQLLQTHGHFDRLTRTKTVESLLAAMDVKGVEEYVSHLGELAQKPKEEDPTITRVWVVDQFMSLIRNGAVPKSDSWLTTVLDFLLLHGIFGIRKKNEKHSNRWLHVLPEPAFSDEARSACQARLLLSLAELTTQTTLLKKDDKTVRSTGCASDGQLWMSKVLSQVLELEKDSKHVVRLGMDDEEDASLRDQAVEVLAMLKTLRPEQKEVRMGSELLLTATLLYWYFNAEANNDEDIEICITSIKRFFPASSSPDKKKKKKEEVQEEEAVSGEDEATPIAAIVDTLIGYLEKPTVYLRSTANQVFGLLTGLVDKSTVDLILAQLARRDPTQEDEEEGVDDVEEGAESGLESDSSESDAISESEDTEDIEEDLELRRKIEEALHISGIQAASEGSEDDDSESEEELMDDDQMMQLDGHLAEIFRSRVKEKGRGEAGAQREATHFKNRVLDLVDIFLRKEPTSEYTVAFIMPIIRVIMGTGSDEKQLSDKATALLRTRFGKTKEVPTTVDLPEVKKTLTELHTIAQKSNSSDLRDTISACSLYLSRILLSDAIQESDAVSATYLASLCDFANRKSSHIQSSFLLEFVRRQPRCAWGLRGDLLELAQKAVNSYRKCQIFQFFQPLLNQVANTDPDGAETLEFIAKFREVMFSVISEACDNKESLTAAQVKELLKLCLLAARHTRRITPDVSRQQTIWNVSDLSELLKKVRTSRFKNSTSLHSVCQQIFGIIGAEAEGEEADAGGRPTQAGNEKKRKAEHEESKDEVKKARRKKVKKWKGGKETDP